MRNKCAVALIFLSVCALPLRGHAQSYWILTYKGTSTTGGGDNLVTEKITEQNFINDAASKAGISTDNLVLVLHRSANEMGDTLEVVNKTDPNLFHSTVFLLPYNFSGSPPESYTNNTSTVVKRFAYIFSADGGHSRGSALINERSNAKGGDNSTATIDGTMQYWLGTWIENAPDPNAIVCSGSFKSKEPLVLP